MSGNKNTKDIIFPVTVLYIQLDTNTGENGESNVQLFKKSMIKMPKMDAPPILTSEYPFFTKNVRYPKAIENYDWKSKYEFFFNRVLFMDRLRKEIDKNPSIYKETLKSKDESIDKKLYEWMQETEKNNVMVTLRALFPIPEVFGKAMKNSYDHILKNGSNSRIRDDINLRNVANIFGFMYKFGIASKEREEYFINIGGKRYEVDDVIWENDLINHPVYKAFLNSQRSTYEEVEKSAPEVEEKRVTYLRKLNDDLKDMAQKEQFHRDFLTLSGACEPKDKCDTENGLEKKLFEVFKKIKNMNKSEIEKTYVKDSKYLPVYQYLIHKYVLKKYNDNLKKGKRLSDYDKMEGLPITDSASIQSNAVQIKEHFDNELKSMLTFEQEQEKGLNAEKLEKDLLEEYASYLKTDTIFMLRMHILSKIKNQPSVQYQSSINDRKNTVESIKDKLKRLSSETGDVAVETIISIKEDLDNHQKMHSSEGIGVFMERDYETLFERLLKSAIEIKAASIVFNFAKNNIPMNLTGKKLDGTDVSPVNQRIIKYIGDFFGTEATINNQLSTNVSNVYEPLRKTSNKELYKVLKLFKLGDAIMKKEHNMTNSEIKEYREVLDKVNDQYILNRSQTTDELDKYLYTGVDEVKSTSGSGEEKKTENEIRRNVQEIYVRMDLVDADKFEKSSKASCKLLDKELEQEFMYLMDPRNKNNSSLSRFRNLDFESVKPNPMITAIENEKPAEIKESTNPLPKVNGGKEHKKMSRRIRSTNRYKTQRNI